jgi:AmiR/NasT family two-component response regulator
MSQMRYPMIVAHSLTQAIAKASQTAPCLIILTGNQQTWSNDLITRFRRITNVHKTPIVALTDFHDPSWLTQEDNPGLDGFLVKPLNGEVLKSVVHSALARQCCESV